MIVRGACLSALIAASGLVAAQTTPDADEPRAMSQSPTMHFVGDRYRIGVGIDTEFDVIGEFQASIHERHDRALIGEGWLGRKGAGGLKMNYHWVFGTTEEMGEAGPVITDGRVAKLFVAADQNQFDDRKLTVGGGFENENWFMGVYGMRALTSERLVNRAITLDEILVTGQIDGRDFSRLDTLERVLEVFEEPYSWGAGLRAGRYFDRRLLRLNAGLDYESGDFNSSQLTASVSLDRQFANTPHSLSLRTGVLRKGGDFVDDRNDWRASLVYGYSFGRSHQPARAFRDVEVEVMLEPRYEERQVATEVTLSDRATFDFDSARLRPAAQETLTELVAAIREGGLVGRIQVLGHTCDIGTEAYNQGLSERRAASVMAFLTENGIEAEEIRAEGRGLHEPRFPNDGEENRSRNRRVEISFVTERDSTERVRVSPEGPVTEIRQEEVPVEAPWIRRALRNPVAHKREVDYFRFETVTETLTEGELEFANRPPVANDVQVSTLRTQPVDIDALANDSDPDGDPLSIVSFSQPANGSVTLEGGVFRYQPDQLFFGEDSFSYTITDGQGEEATARVFIDVQFANQAPVAVEDQASGPANTPITVDVLANDFDPDGDPLEVISVVQITPAPATAVINSDGTITFSISSTCSGINVFRYTISDPFGETASANITVTRTPQDPGLLSSDCGVGSE
ncbi:MAG: Ig-like domain-containing protein [Wenzhouxiangella sp.]